MKAKNQNRTVMFDRILKIYSQNSQIFRSIQIIDNYNDYPKAYHATCYPDLGINNQHTVGNGRAKSKKKALLKAIMEALERYYWLRNKTPPDARDSFYQLSQTKSVPLIEPQKLWFFSERLSNKINWNKVKLQWLRVTELISNKSFFIPKCVFLPAELSKKFQNYSDTSGLAAHFVLEKAYYNAIMELIEREAFAVTYYHRLRLPQLNYEVPINSELHAEIRHVQSYGLQPYLLFFQSDLHIPVVITLLIDNYAQTPPFFSLGMKADLNWLNAASGSLNESLQVLALRELYEHGLNTPLLFNQQISKFPHLKRLIFWSKKENIRHLNFMIGNKRIKLPKNTLSLEQASWFCLKHKLKLKKIQIFGRVLNNISNGQPEYFVVRAFSPNLVSLSLNTDKPYLLNPRLYQLGKQFGSIKTTEQLTKIPHPFI